MKLIHYQSITDNKAMVTSIHHVFNDLPQEVIDSGVLVEELPTPKCGKNQTARLYINPQDNNLWYEYEDKPLTPEEITTDLRERITILENLALESEGVI